MNKIFKVIWNHSAQCWVAVSEFSKTRGKCSSSTDKRKEPAKVFSALVVGAGALISGSAFAAVVTTGTVAIDVAGGTPDGLSVGGLNGGMLIHSNASANNINSSVYFGSELDGIAFANATTFGSNISFNSTITDGNKVNPTLIGSNIVVNGYANTGKTGSPLDASNNTALGSNITVNAWNSTVVGAHASANVRDGTVVGMSAKSMEMSTAIGFGSQALGSESVTIGWNALGTSGSSHVVAIGRMAESLAGSATVLGSTARSANNVTVVVGANTRAMGYGDVAIGHRAVGAGGNATAVGRLAYAAGKQNIALGYQALAGIDNFANGANTTFSARATALLNAKKALALDPTNTTLQTAYDTALANYNSFTLYENATSIGFGAIAAKNNTIAFGTSAVATRENATAFGSLANASSVNATAFGTLAAASRENSIAMGTSANASNINATAIGTLANASTINSIAMGNNATVKGRAGGSIAIGANAIVNDTTNGIAIGNGAQLIRTEGDTSRMSIVIGGDAIIRNTDTSQGRSATVIGGNALAGFLTPSGGSGTTTDDADYATATGLLDSGRLMYRAGITNHQGNVDNGATTITNFLRSNEATAIGADARAIGDQSIAIGAQAVSGHASVAIGGNDFDAIAGYGSTYKDIVGAAMPVSRVPDPVYKKADGSTPDNFYETTYAKSGSVAIGLKTFSNEVMGTALGLAAQVQEGAELGTAIGAGARVGNQTSATGANMTSTSQKSTKGGVAIAAGSVAEGDYTTAIGTSAKALENNSTAISYKALANNTNATAIGALSQATGVDALAIGSGAIASGKESISIGKGNNVSGSHSGAIGDPSYITGSGSYSFGNNNTITTDNTFVFGSGINRNTDLTTNGTLGTVANSVYLGNESEVTGGASSVSGGVGTLKTLDSNQLNTTGTATTAGAIGSVENATVGNVTYGNFQGAKAIGAVSVGASGMERRIQNVAAGEISSTSTDAINGSQLYYVAEQAAKPLTFEANTNAAGDASNAGLTRKLGETLSIIGATTKVDGIVRDTVAPVAGTYSAKNIQTIVTNDGVQIQMAENPEFASVTAKDGDNVTKLAPTGLTTTDGTNTTTVGPNSITVGDTTATDDKPVVITSGKDGGTISNLTTTIAAPTTEVAAAAKPTTNLTNAATLGDVLNAGWNLKENGTAKDVVTAYDTVNFVNGTGTVVNITTTDNVSKVQIDVNTSALTQNITTTDGKAGLPTTGTPDGNKLATANDVINAINNSGWNTNSTTATGTATNTLVKPGAAVNFEAGTNMEVVQKVENGNVSYTYQTKENVTFANTNVTGNLTVGTGDTATTITSGADGLKVAKPDGSATKITNVANGTVSPDSKDAVNGSQLYAVGNATANVLGGTTTVNSTTGAPEGFTFNVKDAAGNTPANLQATNVTGALSNLNTYINQGWIVGNNAGTEVARIAPNEQVNFVDSDTISAEVKTNNDKGGANISFSVKSGTVSGGGNGSTTGSGGFVTGSQVAEAINKSGWSLAADGTAGSELINPSETVTFKAGNNMEVVRDGANITYKTKENVTFTNVNATNVTADTVTVGPVTISKTDGINAGDKKVTGVAAGEISATSTDAVNGSQIFALTGGQTNNVANITVKNPDGTETTYNNVVVDKDGNPALITYNVDGRGEYITNSVITAVNNMNQQGIKFFHTNNSTNRVTSMDQRTNGEDSQAGGAYATAIGYKAIAQGDSALAMGNSATATGENAIAIGINAQATAQNSISVGNGNIVEGKSSGAFGDPNYIMGTDVANVAVSGSYAIGNDNVINSSNTFVLGNNVNNSGTVGANGKPVAQGNTVDNSVYLGNNTTATAGNGSQTASLNNLKKDGTVGATTTAGSTGTVSSATVNGITYGGFAGATANGVVSVGAAGDERRIQNVAAGEISATSTDAINGSQLYAVASRINNGVDQKLGDIYNKMNANDKDLRAGVAGSNAAASLPQVTLPGKSMVAAAAGTYRGQQALAVGYSRLSDNGKVIIKGQANTNTRGQYGAGVGIGYQW